MISTVCTLPLQVTCKTSRFRARGTILHQQSFCAGSCFARGFMQPFLQAMDSATAYYEKLGTASDLREQHRIPQHFMEGLFEQEAPALPPSPVIAFINSRSGGRAGPELSVALCRALGVTQVCFYPLQWLFSWPSVSLSRSSNKQPV
jgi:hypothetical protein